MFINFTSLSSLYSLSELSCECLYSYEEYFGEPAKDTESKRENCLIDP